MHCSNCNAKMERFGVIAWCFPCEYGESLIYHWPKHEADTHGIAEYEQDRQGVKADLVFNNIKEFLTPGAKVVELFPGVGLLLKKLVNNGYIAAGVEPRSGYELIQSMVGIKDRVVSRLEPITADFVIVNDADAYTNLEALLTIIEAKVFLLILSTYNLGPRNVFNWNHFKPDDRKYIFSDAGIKKWANKQGFSCQLKNISNLDLKIVILKK